MTVSAIIPDPRQRERRSPDYIFVVRAGTRAEVQRDHDLDRLTAQRDYLLNEGAQEA